MRLFRVGLGCEVSYELGLRLCHMGRVMRLCYKGYEDEVVSCGLGGVNFCHMA